MAESAPQAPAEQAVPRLNRACDSCRALKVRCLPGDPLSTSKCERCFTLARECIHALPAKRKPRKRADPKLVELEKEVKALSAILRRQQQRQPPEAPSAADSMHIEHEEPLSWPLVSSNASNSSPSSTPFTSPGGNSELEKDAVGRGMLSQDSARQYLSHFIRRFIVNHPFLHFPESISLDELRLSRPATFLAMMAAASCVFNPIVCEELYKELAKTFAEQIIVNGAKSLDLLQALLIGILWHHPGDTFDSYNYLQYAQLAAAIVGWLRLGKGAFVPALSVTSRTADSNSTSTADGGYFNNAVNNESLEQHRTFLASYIICARVCSKQSQPSIVPFASWVQDHIDQLESSPAVTDADKTIIALVRQQRIIEDFISSRGGDGIAVPVDLGTPRVQSVLKSFEQQLSAWKLSADYLLTPGLEILFFGNQVYLHEMAMYIDYDPLGFRLPYSLERAPSAGTSERQMLTPAHIDSLFVCQSASQRALDIFLQTELEVLRGCPDITFITVNYCVVILIKLLVSTREPSSPISNLFDWQSLRVSYYLDQVGNQLRSAAAGEMSRIASKCAIALSGFQKWYSARYDSAKESSEEVLQSFKYMGVQHNGSEPNNLAPSSSAERDLTSHTANDGIFNSEYSQNNTQNSWQLFHNDFDFMDTGCNIDGNSLVLFQDVPAFDSFLFADLDISKSKV